MTPWQTTGRAHSSRSSQPSIHTTTTTTTTTTAAAAVIKSAPEGSGKSQQRTANHHRRRWALRPQALLPPLLCVADLNHKYRAPQGLQALKEILDGAGKTGRDGKPPGKGNDYPSEVRHIDPVDLDRRANSPQTVSTPPPAPSCFIATTASRPTATWHRSHAFATHPLTLCRLWRTCGPEKVKHAMEQLDTLPWLSIRHDTLALLLDIHGQDECASMRSQEPTWMNRRATTQDTPA